MAVAARSPFNVLELTESIDWTITSGYPGSASTLLRGPNSAAIPGPGEWKLVSFLTKMYVSNTDIEGRNTTAELLALKSGDTITFIDSEDPNNSVTYLLGADTSAFPTYVDFPVVSIDSLGPGGDVPFGVISYVDQIIDPVNYIVRKSSFEQFVPEQLGVNISPFATDRFVHLPILPSPTTFTDLMFGWDVTVQIDDGVNVSSYTCYDGWEEFLPGTVGLSTTDLVRSVSPAGHQTVTIASQNIDNVRWITNTNNNVVHANPDMAKFAYTIPVLPPDLILGPNDRTLKIQGRTDSNTIVWEIDYTIECSWGRVMTIGFINRFGVWEYFDCLGRPVFGTAAHRNVYTSYSNGIDRNYNVNGNRSLTVNTGWVNQNFDSVYEDLLLSEAIIMNEGTQEDTVRLILQQDAITYKDNYNEKVINYTIPFMTAGKVIEIVQQ
jgi:hypothetical protein